MAGKIGDSIQRDKMKYPKNHDLLQTVTFMHGVMSSPASHACMHCSKRNMFSTASGEDCGRLFKFLRIHLGPNLTIPEGDAVIPGKR
jgi:hypothetical protein